ncbi:MAG TPA: RNB domain-containing ribonuclease [Solirubrobacteraceae bacterium]
MSPAAPPRPDTLVGVLERRGRFWVVEPFFERGRRLAVDKPGRPAGEGDLVVVRPGTRGRRAVVERPVGRPDVARDVLEGLMLDRGLHRRFDDAVERAARTADPEPGPRRDLRDLPTLTIDPVTARDFDDAISAEALGEDRWRVWVHIADVAAHVPPGSLVDREASRRATSVYVPGAVEPMLPEALSNAACSLVPGEDRLAVTVEMELTGADVRRARFHRSLIRSDVRLDYERVDRIFAGEEAAEAPWAEPLAVARAAAGAMAAARAAQGALVVESSEPDFEFDDDGHVVAAHATEQTESHRLIEHLMIAANEQVATRLEQGGIPTLYRVHERPEPMAVERLAGQLASLGVATPPLAEQMSSTQAAEAVAEMSVLVDAEVRRRGHGRQALTALILRALKQARYDPENLGHAGLRSPRYCHFTSPIRRYPDLVCHRALLSTLDGGEPPPDRRRLDELAAWTSGRERDAMKVERDADDVARCFLLERALFADGWDRDWEGEVVGLVGAGAFVGFGDGYEGFLPVRRLRGEWWELNEEGTVLHGTRSGRTLSLGDPVRVEVERVEPGRGRVDLLPVEV